MKTISLENLNLLLINDKLNGFVDKQGTTAVESKCRLVNMVLRHKIHHFPIDIPFVAAVKNCENGKVAVFNIKRKKMAIIPGNSVAAETSVGKTFKIRGVTYTLADTINGFERYKPDYKPNNKACK